MTGLRLIKHNGRNALLLASGRAAKEFGSCLNFPLLRIVEFLFGEIKRHALTRRRPAIVVICQGASPAGWAHRDCEELWAFLHR